MKNVSTKGASGLPKASILGAPVKSGAMKVAKTAAKKAVTKAVMKGAAKSLKSKRAK